SIEFAVGPRPSPPRAATSKRLYRTRVELPAPLLLRLERASGKALTLIVQVDFLRALGDAESLRANSHAKLPQYALRFWHRNWSVFLVIRGFSPAISCARNKD